MSFDSLADGYLTSKAAARCFDAQATVERMLEFEAALARVEARLGIIPADAAPVIAAACEARRYDRGRLEQGTADGSNPAIPLVEMLQAEVAATDADAARYVHWGSTSQDVMDTVLVLQLRAAVETFEPALATVAATLADLAKLHRSTPMVARTLSQQALPTTFGLKAALWLDAILTGQALLVETSGGLPLQFAGAGGTLASFGGRGSEVRDALAGDLGLRAALPWQADRTPIRRVAGAAALLAASAGKVATDLILMMQTEVGELREARAPGRGGSSSLPQKRNPVASMAVVAGARRIPGLLATLHAAFDFEHERAAGAWHAEWRTVPEIFVTLGSMLEQLARALTGIEVDARAMAHNLGATRGLVMAESVVMQLARDVGRERAQMLVKSAVGQTADTGGDFRAALAALPEVQAHLGDDGLDRALDPLQYVGAANDFIDQILERYEHA